MSRLIKRPPLVGMNAKINWAKEHLRTLNDEIRRWIDSKPYSTIQECNDEYTDYVLGLRFDNFPDVVDWALMAGDVLFSLRCALDHLVYALAVAAAGSDPPPDFDKLAFPITDSPSKFKHALARKKLSGLSCTTITMIEGMQPYPGRNTNLARLRDLNDIDKHRLLNLAVICVKKANVRLDLPGDAPPFQLWINDAPLEQETPLMRVTFIQPHRDMCMNLDFTFRISFWDEPQRGIAMPEFLSEVGREVSGIVNKLRPPNP